MRVIYMMNFTITISHLSFSLSLWKQLITEIINNKHPWSVKHSIVYIPYWLKLSMISLINLSSQSLCRIFQVFQTRSNRYSQVSPFLKFSELSRAISSTWYTHTFKHFMSKGRHNFPSLTIWCTVTINRSVV